MSRSLESAVVTFTTKKNPQLQPFLERIRWEICSNLKIVFFLPNSLRLHENRSSSTMQTIHITIGNHQQETPFDSNHPHPTTWIKFILTPQNKMTPWLGHPSSWKKGLLFHGSIYFWGGQVCFVFGQNKTSKWKMAPEIWRKVPSDAWKKPPPETFTASTVTKVAPGSKLMGNCGSGTMSCDDSKLEVYQIPPTNPCIRLGTPIQGAGSPPDTTCSHRDFGINLHLPFLVGGVNPKVYTPLILGRYVQSTPTCQNNLKQKSLKTKGFLHHLFHTFLVLKHIQSHHLSNIGVRVEV